MSTSSTNPVEGEIVLSYGEYGFQAVLNALDTAKRISIVTYSLSANNQLLGHLQKASCPVRLITNIPPRQERGYRHESLKVKKDEIGKYLHKLEPELFGPFSRIFFNFKNHAKIISTDTVAYVGSGNFSDASRLNWECGIVMRSQAALSQIEQMIDAIESASIRYYGTRASRLAVSLAAIESEMSIAINDLIHMPSAQALDQLRTSIKTLGDMVRLQGDEVSWQIFGVGQGPISSTVNLELIEIIECKACGLEELWIRLAKARDGDVDAGILDFDNDGNIIEGSHDAFANQIEQQADTWLIDIQRFVRDLCRQIAEASTRLSSTMIMIDNTN